MIPYVLVLLGSMLVDCIPVFAPPAWMLMLFIMFKFDLNPYVVVIVGTIGTVCGRMIFVTCIVPWLGRKAIGSKKDSDLKFVGEKLSQKGLMVFIFVFVYAILPLSTTALFMTAGLAKFKKKMIIPPFFLGNLIGDGALLIFGKYTITHISDFYKDSLSLKNIALMAFGLVFMSLFLFIDWRRLLEKKEIKLKFKFWQ
jgi:hypothetical protein